MEDPTATWNRQLSACDAHHLLLANIRARRVEIDKLWETVTSEWVGEDLIYRFWHQSFKVFTLQDVTVRVVALLEAINPTDAPLNPWFRDIVYAGTGLRFELSHNDDWPRHTRPIIEAFFHARFFLDMLHRFAAELEEAPTWLPSGWAALLELYQIR